MNKLKFFDAVAEARKGHTIESETIVPLVWSKEKQALVLKNNNDHIYDPCITAELLDNEQWTVIKEKRNILWAAEQMDKGLKVKRAQWSSGHYYIMKNDAGDVIDYEFRGWDSAVEDLLGEDWELF